MLSYQHGYHAGNHADLIKHLGWIATIVNLKKKNKPFVLFDTHAGAGSYNLNSDISLKNKEYLSGVAPIMAAESTDDLVNLYQNILFNYWNEGVYLGSPCLAKSLLRSQDQLQLMELHPAEFRALKKNINQGSSNANIHIHHRNGLEGCVALSPPTPNRGALLIDPPYETQSEYSEVSKTVDKVLKRWLNAQIMIWYPLLSDRAGAKSGASERMCSQVGKMSNHVVDIQLIVDSRDSDKGMYGSGLVIVNPSWNLADTIKNSLENVIQVLGENAQVNVNWLANKEEL